MSLLLEPLSFYFTVFFCAVPVKYVSVGPFCILQAVWETEEHNEHVVLFHTSRDGDAGYPGDVSVNVTYQLTEDNQFVITFTARARRKATPINLTSHPYFNLGGHVSWSLCQLDSVSFVWIIYFAHGKVHEINTASECSVWLYGI